MGLFRWKPWSARSTQSARCHTGKPRYRSVFRPLVQVLEDRLLPATFFVNNNNPNGLGSLRQAIIDANELPGGDDVRFNIPGPGPHTIQPTENLPEVTDPVVIDGTSQPGYSGAPLIELNGSLAGEFGLGLFLSSGNSSVKGLVINGFGYAGLDISGTNNVVEACFIGTDITGTGAVPNGDGIFISGIRTTIGGNQMASRNVISGNTRSGVILFAGMANKISGNYIGVDVSGSRALGNGDGLYISSGGNHTIGGTTLAERNVISGNDSTGIGIFDGYNSVIQGNYIGTDWTGTTALANHGAGIFIFSSDNIRIGGAAGAAGNLISGNTLEGLEIGYSSHNRVSGNKIGTDVNGEAALPNGGNGISIFSAGVGNMASNNWIGGTTSEARNLISGNVGNGIRLFGSKVFGTVIDGNYIGTNGDGNKALGNGKNGISLEVGGNIIGGTTISGNVNLSGNLISGNAQSGIRISSDSNRVQGNRIGTDITGTRSIGNNGYGIVLIFDAEENVIGGALVVNDVHAARNLISGNGNAGVHIGKRGFSAPSNNVVQGNFIGTDYTGKRAVGNGGDGVSVFQSVGNSIGGIERGAANLIAYNGRDGFSVTDGGSIGVRENTFFANANLGIRLVNNGNRRQAAPDLDTVISHGSSTMISGSLQSTPDTDFALEFFSSAACDPSGFGEGEEFFGSASVITSAGGRVRFQFIFNTPLTRGRVVTATATDPRDNTSEFSACQAVTTPAPFPNAPTRAAAVAYVSGVFPMENPPLTSETRSTAPHATEVGLKHAVSLPESRKPPSPRPRPITFYGATLPMESGLTDSVWEAVAFGWRELIANS